MSSKNTNSELQAEFDELLEKVLARRGKRRQKHIVELKAFFGKFLTKLAEFDFYKNLEVGNLSMEIKSLQKKLEEAKQ